MLVDTSGFFSLYDKDEKSHRKAVSLYNSAQRLVTTNYVLAEYVALAYCSRRPAPGSRQIQRIRFR